LQELKAPRFVEFFTSEWIYISDKRSEVEELSRITRVDKGVLLKTKPVRISSVARIMSWASKRVTTRKEDVAYCLLGLFGIYMALLYGEGDRAFVRLQEEILKQSSDQSLFAWNPLQAGAASRAVASEQVPVCGLFSPSPACFAETGDVFPLPEYCDTESTLTNRGLRVKMQFKYDILNKTFIGILCCASASLGKDVAIDFISPSNSINDLDHLIRCSTSVRYGNWFDDEKIHFNSVYLATETSLWQSRYLGRQFLKPEAEFHTLLKDPSDFSKVDEILELYSREALVESSIVDVRDSMVARRISVLNPLKGRQNSVAMLLPTKLSVNIALVFGFTTLENGSPDVHHSWSVFVPIKKQHSLQDLWSEVQERPPSKGIDSLQIKIDRVSISVVVSQPYWWARTCREATISLR
jgi:hypothetical protein